MLKFIGPLIVVEDIAVSRQFYEQILGQKVQYDFGEDVQFEGNLSIHQKAHFQDLLGGAQRFPVTLKSNAAELYFEAIDIEAVQERLKQAGAAFIHEVHEQPWGQRAMRLYDPDGHILEIGEAFASLIARLHQQGLTIEDISQRTGLPQEDVREMLKG